MARIILDYEILPHGTEFFDCKTGALLFTTPTKRYSVAQSIWYIWYGWYQFRKLFRRR